MIASPPDTETSRWYEEKVRRFGFDHRGLGFNSRSAQEKRFEALLELGDFNGRRLLDVGCGFGDFLAFLQERDIRPIYTGIDICEPMIGHCRKRFSQVQGRFEVSDVLEHGFEQPCDFIVASGIFGLDAPGTRERIRPTLARMFAAARVGAAANFLSRRTPTPAESRVYVEPAEALALGLELTPATRLDHTYLPNDFTLHLYKTPAWEGEKASTA